MVPRSREFGTRMWSGPVPPTAPTVIFVHGLRTSATMWDEQVRFLTAAGFPTRAVDLPGHGVRRGETFTMAGALDVLDRTIADLSTGSYVLVGLSLGGYTSLHYAAQTTRAARTTRADGASRHVDASEVDASEAPGLVGVLAAACSSNPGNKPVRIYRDVAALVARHGEKTRAFLRHRKIIPTPIPAFADRLPWSVVTDALTALDRVSSIDDLHHISVPVLLVNGQWDHLRLEERAHLAAAARARLVVIPGAKHDVSAEAPTEFNRTLLRFLDSLPAPHTTTG